MKQILLLLCLFVYSLLAAQCAQQTVGFYTYPATDEGKSVTLDCDQKELYSGSVTRKCLSGGVWESPNISCTRNKCPQQSLIGSSIWPSTPTNENVTVGCHWGQTGSQTRRCNLDKTWATPYSTCAECNCPENVDDVYQQKWTYGMCDVVYNHRICPDGFDGLYTRKCSHDGHWNEVVNACIAKVCNAEYFQNVYWNTTVYNTTTSVSCPRGYTGIMTRFCNIKYKWEDPVSFCVPGMPYIHYNETRFLGKVNIVIDPIIPSYFVNAQGSLSIYGLPKGLFYNPSNGYISGASTEGGQFTVTIIATNSAGTFTTQLTFVIISVVCYPDHEWPLTLPEHYAYQRCFMNLGNRERYCGVDQDNGGAIWNDINGSCAGDWIVLILIIVLLLAAIGFIGIKLYRRNQVKTINAINNNYHQFNDNTAFNSL